jgi:hypothetical protein
MRPTRPTFLFSPEKLIMREAKRIADELRRALEGEAWHGPSVLETLDGVTAEMAAAHPFPGAHSIWEILLHIGAWPEPIRQRAIGVAVELQKVQDWPPVNDTSEGAWGKTIEDLKRSQARLIDTVLSMQEEDLSLPAPGRNHDRLHMLFGLVQHHAYHAGQIQLLKRALEHQAGGKR